MKRVLFIDDEPKILTGLRRMLRPFRNEWEMAFCDSGETALEWIENHEVDIVVTDMRMPIMDGAELLRRVRKVRPGTVRVILSGHSDRALTLNSIGPAHQFLSKPCEPKLLQQSLCGALQMQDQISNSEIRTYLESLESLPSQPYIYQQFRDELSEAEPDIDRIIELLTQDLGMMAKVLQLVHSSFFGLPIQVGSIAEAAHLLGADLLKSLVFEAEAFRAGKIDPVDRRIDQAPQPANGSQGEIASGPAGPHRAGEGKSRFALDSLTQHSNQLASLSFRIAERWELDELTAKQTFVAGLLHDIGIVALQDYQPEAYSHIEAELAAGKGTLSELELAHFGVTHSEAGAYLLGLWGFPTEIIDTVAKHHSPNNDPTIEAGSLAAVYAAELYHESETPNAPATYSDLPSSKSGDSWVEELSRLAEAAPALAT